MSDCGAIIQNWLFVVVVKLTVLTVWYIPASIFCLKKYYIRFTVFEIYTLNTGAIM